MTGKGHTSACEIKQLRDEATGATLWQITDHPSINHGLYFLTSSFTPDERSIIFASFRTGSANFFRAGFPDGPIVQLTDAPDINSFSAVISDDGATLYFTRGSAIVALDLTVLDERLVADFPGGKLGEVDLSADGQWITSAIRIDGVHGIVTAATDGSGGAIIHRQPRTIIHPQFHPADPTLIEYASDPAPRMHLIRRDGTENRCLYQHGNDEFVVHETWLGRTSDLVFTVWPLALKRMRLPAGTVETIAEFNAWHITPSPDGRYILCDTNHPDIGLQIVDVATGARRTLCQSLSSNRGSQWIKGRYAMPEDFAAAAKAGSGNLAQELSWMEMKTDTVYGPQWTHPHPSFSPTGRWALFTSDRTGHSQVYAVETGL